MAWTTPPTWTSGQPITSSFLNDLRNNLLETAAAKATTSGSYFAVTGPNALAERIATSQSVLAGETTGSTSYTNLATGGPAVTVTSGARILDIISGSVSNNTVNNDSFMSVEISGATSVSPSDSFALSHTSATANARVNASYLALHGVTAGSNTITAKYRVDGGTGTFQNRRITVLPF